MPYEIPSTVILCNFVTVCKHSGINGGSQPSGKTNSVGNFSTANREADEGAIGNKNSIQNREPVNHLIINQL